MKNLCVEFWGRLFKKLLWGEKWGLCFFKEFPSRQNLLKRNKFT
jgi:hypothetical protein